MICTTCYFPLVPRKNFLLIVMTKSLRYCFTNGSIILHLLLWWLSHAPTFHEDRWKCVGFECVKGYRSVLTLICYDITEVCRKYFCSKENFFILLFINVVLWEWVPSSDGNNVSWTWVPNNLPKKHLVSRNWSDPVHFQLLASVVENNTTTHWVLLDKIQTITRTMSM